MDKCKFHTAKDKCQILMVSECDGDNRSCGFFKTEQQYANDFNHAVALNRAKGNCLKCKYQKKICQYMEE